MPRGSVGSRGGRNCGARDVRGRVCLVGKHRIKAGIVAFRVTEIKRSDVTQNGHLRCWICEAHFQLIETTIKMAVA